MFWYKCFSVLLVQFSHIWYVDLYVNKEVFKGKRSSKLSQDLNVTAMEFIVFQYLTPVSFEGI
jgi:hypothetical protein